MKRIAFAFIAALLPVLAGAQAFPSKVVKINVPFSASSGPAVFLHVLAEKLSKTWGERVIIDPKPGASGFIAIEAVKNAAPDGHELLIVSNSHVAINPSLYKKLPYDPEKDFVPVALVYRAPYFVAVSASGPYQTVPALIAAAKANPGKLSYGIAFVGSPPHLGGAQFAYLTGTEMTAVPFKEQTQLYVAIANGDLAWALSTVGSALPLMKAGRIRLIAIATPSRSPAYPEIPTLEEAGGPAVEIDAWLALMAPRGTPNAVVRRINADLTRQMGDPDVIERLRVLGFQAAPDSPEEVARLIREDTKKYREVVRRIGVTAD
jgi:tripartite-type tricarboxylate transporter receptor subunit TctC